jgi:hypothetical protein
VSPPEGDHPFARLIWPRIPGLTRQRSEVDNCPGPGGFNGVPLAGEELPVDCGPDYRYDFMKDPAVIAFFAGLGASGPRRRR